MMQKTQSQQPQQQKIDEHILVIQRKHLFPVDSAFYGIQPTVEDEFLSLVQRHKEFHPRSLMESDLTYKQIIPYLVFHHNGRYFLMQRQAKASETRLQNKFTLGIGGHIRQEDLTSDCIFDWAKREFHEEVDYKGNLTMEQIGLLNDDTNAVGQVHIGFVLLLHGDSAEIAVKSELKSGELVTLEQMQTQVESMESWSQLVYDFLIKR